MGVFDYLFKRNYRIYDNSCGIIDNLPEADENTFVRTAPHESIIIRNIDDSLEITILDNYDRIISKSLNKKRSIVSYDLRKYTEKVSTFRKRYYQCYDIVIEAIPDNNIQIADMYYEEAVAMYDFLSKHLKNA
jgi:hypothetical protein